MRRILFDPKNQFENSRIISPTSATAHHGRRLPADLARDELPPLLKKNAVSAFQAASSNSPAGPRAGAHPPRRRQNIRSYRSKPSRGKRCSEALLQRPARSAIVWPANGAFCIRLVARCAHRSESACPVTEPRAPDFLLRRDATSLLYLPAARDRFILAINAPPRAPQALAPASRPCFSLADHLATVERRARPPCSIPMRRIRRGTTPCAEALLPTWNTVKSPVNR